MEFRTSLPRFICCLALVVSSAVALIADDDPGDRFVANEVVVKLDPVSGATIGQIHADYGTATLSTVLESAAIYLISVPVGNDVENLAGDLEDDPRILYAEPNYITSVPQSDGHVIWAWSGGEPEVGAFPGEIVGQAPTQSLELPAVHPMSTGQGVVVAVLDTGVDMAHPNLEGNLLTTGYDFVDDDPVPQDRRMNLDADADGKLDENFGHGTHVAGTVLLAAPDAKILPVRVLDSEGRGNAFTLAEAIDHAVRAGAQVINLSLGMDFYSGLLEEATERAREAGVLIVAAAGNANSDLPRYPAADDKVLGVASVDDSDLKSAFTNWGSWVGVSAPGEAIISAFPENTYAAWSGTSMAAPLVAGQAALLKAIFPAMVGDDLIKVISRTAFNIDALNPNWEKNLGTGRIDLLASTRALLAGQSDIGLNDAINHILEGWDEGYISTVGTPVALLDDGEYRFSIGEAEVVLELWDSVSLAIGQSVRVAGEIEWADESHAGAILYELDPMWIEDLDGNRIGTGGQPVDDLGLVYGNRAKGTLAELVSLMELRQDDDLNVRTTGTLGAGVMTSDDEEDEYLFTDNSGVPVILDLDSRANLDFLLTPGIELEIIGELESINVDEDLPAGALHKLDAVWIRLPDGTSLDIGQLTPYTGSTITDWIGYFWKVDATGWFYHPSKGYLFGGQTFGDDDWFFSSNLADWIYASRTWYPFVFANSAGWHYLIGTPFGGLQHAYSYDRNEWILDFWKMYP